MTITVNSVSEYIQRNDLRRNAGAIISNGVMTLLVNGERLSQDDFDRRYPVADYVPESKARGDNPDKTKNYLNNIKSY